MKAIDTAMDLGKLPRERLSSLACLFDRPVPRYTSYPTAVQFTSTFGPEDYRSRLREAAARPGEPLSVYIHIPFCNARCAYCACQVIATRKKKWKSAAAKRTGRQRIDSARPHRVT